MPAVPAWPPDSGVRLFVDQPLAAGATVTLTGPPAHYLVTVMRLRPGDAVRLFDDRTGEWRAQLVDAGKRGCTLSVHTRLREREQVPDVWLGAAPLRRARYDWLAEKACELGVARFTPVLTERTQGGAVNAERLRAQMVEAAEQCGRTALPELDGALRLEGWLAALGERPLLFADETGGAPLRTVAPPAPVALLIGPEGGFTPAERERVRAHPHAVAVSLGPRVLRAETAALALLAAWSALAGDWG